MGWGGATAVVPGGGGALREVGALEELNNTATLFFERVFQRHERTN